LPKKAIESKQSEKLRLALMEKGHGEVSAVDFEEMVEMQQANELQEIELQIASSRKAENDMNHLSRQIMRENMPLKTEIQFKELTLMSSTFKNYYEVHLKTQQHINKNLVGLKSVFAEALQNFDIDMSELVDKRRTKHNNQKKNHSIKLNQLVDIRKQLLAIEQENNEKLRKVEERLVKSSQMYGAKPAGGSFINGGTGKSMYGSNTYVTKPNTIGQNYQNLLSRSSKPQGNNPENVYKPKNSNFKM